MTTPLPPHMNPLSPEEIRDLLSATLHGPLPHPTVQRLLSTVAPLGSRALRAKTRRIEEWLDNPDPDEAYDHLLDLRREMISAGLWEPT